MYQEERDVLLIEMRKIDECDTEKFGTLYRSEKTVAVSGDRWWPHTAKQGYRVSKKFLCTVWNLSLIHI